MRAMDIRQYNTSATRNPPLHPSQEGIYNNNICMNS